MVPRIITLAVGLFFGTYLQSPPFENQAILRVRQLNVARLDSALHERTFGSWIQRVVGPRAGITWQLTECGVSPESRGEIQACVETCALLPDDRKVVVQTRVGSFQRGIYGEPKLQFALVESRGEIYEASRLGDLPQLLRKPLIRAPERVASSVAPAPILLPVVSLVPNLPGGAQSLPSRTLLDNSVGIPAFDLAPAATQPQRVSEGVLIGSAVTRVLPEYPRFAKQLHLAGEVKVEVTIDTDGRVVEVQSISGPNPLRPPAEEAARKWVFNPTMLNKVPVRVRGYLTFIFTKP